MQPDWGLVLIAYLLGVVAGLGWGSMICRQCVNRVMDAFFKDFDKPLR